MANLKVENFGESTAKVIFGEDQSLSSGLEADRLLNLVSEAGAVILKGFNTQLESFSEFVDHVSARTSLDPSRDFYDKLQIAQWVDPGKNAIPLHCENGSMPWRSDLVWFYCRVAANENGHTTICDGLAVYEGLSDEAKSFFEGKKGLFKNAAPRRYWKAFTDHEMPETQELSDQEIVAKLNRDYAGNSRFRLDPSGMLHSEFVIPIIQNTKNCERPAFANSLLSKTFYGQMVLEDGSSIPEPYLTEVQELAEALTQEIAWDDGDIAVLDNWRFMHGRRAFADVKREMFVALSFV